MLGDTATVEQTATVEETAPLLTETDEHAVQDEPDHEARHEPFTRMPASALPIALISALAVAATAATQIYAYATLLCKDAQHCDEDERRKFAGAVAIATTVANFCALFAIRGFEALSRRHTRIGLSLWLVVRSMSVGALSLGVLRGSIGVAMSSQFFEGLASDNILHFNLNAIYVRAPKERTVSKLIGSSLALYMAGISISPSVAGVLHNFRDSFVMAYVLFLAALIYLVIAVRVPIKAASKVSSPPARSRVSTMIGTAFSPFLFFLEDGWRLLPGMAIFLYNAVQSYTFSAVMVHTSIHFEFSSRENGFLLTIVHILASLYLFSALFLIPRLSSLWSKQRMPTHSSARDAYMALVSLLVQAGSLLLFAFADEPWQVYATSALLALGLASPSFIKSYFVAHFEPDSKPRALAALAVMETGGGLVAPVMLGGLQATWPGRGMFFVAACCITLASMLLGSGVILNRRRISDR